MLAFSSTLQGHLTQGSLGLMLDTASDLAWISTIKNID